MMFCTHRLIESTRAKLVLYLQLSLPRRYAIEIVFIDWRVSDGTSAIAFICNLKDPSDVSNGGECTRCTRTRVYDAVDVRTYAFSRYGLTQKYNTVLSMREHVWHVRGGTIDI